jgi:ribosomal protein S18 acetylase RimI-like enzyme
MAFVIVTMTTVIIRKAHERDIVDVVFLLGQLWYKQTVQSFQETFDLYTTSQQYGLLVAEEEEDGWTLGMVAYSMTHIFSTGKTRIHIEALVVFAPYRRRGIGRQLTEAVEKIARTHAPCVVDLVSRVTRAKHGAHAFYRSMGYECLGDSAKTYFKKDFIN